MKKVSYHWNQGYCGDGCCSWDESTVDVYDENGRFVNTHETVGTMFDVSDLEQWMEGYYGKEWRSEFVVDVEDSTFY